MARHRQRLCRICHKNPVWTHGDVADAQGTCKRCYHKHVWAGRLRPRDERTGAEAGERAPLTFWESGLAARGSDVRPEDLG